MTRCEETKLTNFLLNALRRKNQLRKALIEYKFMNSNSDNVKPDLLVYLIDNSTPYCYIIFEFKQRTVLDTPRIRDQYEKYSHVNPNCFDSLIIPVPNLDLPVFINSIYYNTPNGILTSILNDINFRDEDGILNYNTLGSQARVLHQFKQSNNQQNDNIINSIISRSSSQKLWNRIILPFTLRDFEGIQFLDNHRNEIRIKNDVSSSIIISHLFTFIFQRKRRNLQGKFHIDVFFDHLFSSIRGLVLFGDDDKRGIIRKLDLFLQLVCNICEKKKRKLIKKSEAEQSHFIIEIKNTDNFVTRMEKIQEILNIEIDKQRLQNRVTDFL